MSETIVKHELPIPVPVSNGGGRGPVAGFPDHDAGGGPTPGRTRQVYRTGMWMGLVAISMFFISFTSAYIVRGGMGEDWQALSLPPVLWLTTVLLAASSATLEWTRKALQEGRREACNRWLLATVALGMAFLAGQVVAWKQLSALGIYVATNPSSSFFYLLTARTGFTCWADWWRCSTFRCRHCATAGAGAADGGGCDGDILAFHGWSLDIHIFVADSLEVKRCLRSARTVRGLAYGMAADRRLPFLPRNWGCGCLSFRMP